MERFCFVIPLSRSTKPATSNIMVIIMMGMKRMDFTCKLCVKLTSNRPMLFPKYLQLPHPTSTKTEPNGKDCTNDSTLGQGL